MTVRQADQQSWDICVVGGGVAGLSAAIFTARAGLNTLVVDGGQSILARNASLENYPGFPAGVDARRYLNLVVQQAETAGASILKGLATGVEAVVPGEREGFLVEVQPRDEDALGSADALDRTLVETRRLIVASWPDSSYVTDLDVGREQRGSKYVLSVDDGGRTAVDGVYAAGRIAGRPHQTIVAAGHGATVGLAAIHDADVPFYHDWVAPEGYFTGRDREVPPGCEEIDDDERLARDERSRETVLGTFADPLADRPTMHPSVRED